MDAFQVGVEEVVTNGNKLKNKEVQLDLASVLNKFQPNFKEVVTQPTLLQNMVFFAPKVVTTMTKLQCQ